MDMRSYSRLTWAQDGRPRAATRCFLTVTRSRFSGRMIAAGARTRGSGAASRFVIFGPGRCTLRCSIERVAFGFAAGVGVTGTYCFCAFGHARSHSHITGSDDAADTVVAASTVTRNTNVLSDIIKLSEALA